MSAWASVTERTTRRPNRVSWTCQAGTQSSVCLTLIAGTGAYITLFRLAARSQEIDERILGRGRNTPSSLTDGPVGVERSVNGVISDALLV